VKGHFLRSTRIGFAVMSTTDKVLSARNRKYCAGADRFGRVCNPTEDGPNDQDPFDAPPE